MKLQPHEFSALVNELAGTARQFANTQQLREAIVETLNRNGITPDHPHLRPKPRRK